MYSYLKLYFIGASNYIRFGSVGDVSFYGDVISSDALRYKLEKITDTSYILIIIIVLII